MPVLLPPSSELSSYPELSTCLATCSSYHPCHFSSATAASWQPLSPPSVRWDRRGSASLHRRRGWRIPCLCLQPLSLRLRLGPSTQRLTSAPSSLVSTVTRRPTSSTGLPLPPALPWSVVVPPSSQDSAPPAAPWRSIPPAPANPSLSPFSAARGRASPEGGDLSHPRTVFIPHVLCDLVSVSR